MAKPSFRAYLASNHDGMLTAWLLSPFAVTDDDLSAFAATPEEAFAQLTLAVEESKHNLEEFVWQDEVHLSKVQVEIHPQTVIHKRYVIAQETIPLEISYAWSKLKQGGYRVILPRFAWWFVLEDLSIATKVITQAVSQTLLGEKTRSIYDFRPFAQEQLVAWSPTLKRKRRSAPKEENEESQPTLHAVAEELTNRQMFTRKLLTTHFDFRSAISVMTQHNPGSILMVGPSGVGKTSWVEALARQPEIPKIWRTSADRIIAGMAYLGMWEKRCLDLIEELSDSGDYLFVDRLLPIAAPQTSRSSIADMFLPALQAGEIRLLAECTSEELAQLTITDPTFVSLFFVIHLHPPASHQIPSLLHDYQTKLNSSIRLSPPALRRLTQHLAFFHRNSSFPGKGFRFLDRLPTLMKESPKQELSANEVSKAFAQATHLPLELISDAYSASPAYIAERLQEGVIGQDEACKTAARVLTRFKSGLCDPDKPIGSLFFVGPTGVGKTELAKQLTRYLFADAKQMIRFDMSEYMVAGSSRRLLEVGRGVQSLVQQVQQKPLSVLLFDEIEKAHGEVFDLLLALLGEGRLSDSTGRLVDFRMTLIIMTSNLGVQSRGPVGFGQEGAASGDFLRAVRSHFRPEFFNRIDHVIAFNSLSSQDLLKIVDLELDKASQRSGILRRGLRLRVDVDARNILVNLGFHPKHGARPLRRVIEEQIMGPLAVELAATPTLAQRTIHVVGSNNKQLTYLRQNHEFVIVLDSPSHLF